MNHIPLPQFPASPQAEAIIRAQHDLQASSLFDLRPATRFVLDCCYADLRDQAIKAAAAEGFDRAEVTDAEGSVIATWYVPGGQG